MRVNRQQTNCENGPPTSLVRPDFAVHLTSFLAFLLAFGGTAEAQRNFGMGNGYTKQSEVLEVPRQYQSLIEDARGSIQRKQWSEATLALGTVLGLEQTKIERAESAIAEPQLPDSMLNRRIPGMRPNRQTRRQSLTENDKGQDYFFAEETEGHYKKSMRGEAKSLLATMPVEGAKIVELRYGLTAQQNLDLAVAAQDWDAIAKVGSDFGFTSAGRQALWLEAEHWLNQGDALAAAGILQGLLSQPAARQEFGSELPLLAAYCWKIGGASGSALEVVRMARELGYDKLSWNGKPIATDGTDESLFRGLDAIPIGKVREGIEKNKEWKTPLGRSDGNAHSHAGTAIFRWDVPLHPSPQDSASAMQTYKNRLLGGHVDIPSRIPLVVGPWVIVRTYDQRTIAIHQVTGKLSWCGQFDGTPIRPGALNPMQSDPFGGMGAIGPGMQENPVPERILSSVWADVANGQLSSDGKNVYGICDVAVKQAVDNLIQGVNMLVPRGSRQSFNLLRSWDLETEGKILWEVGGETGEDEPLLSGALFLGAPTPCRGELLTLAELNGEVYLLSLSPKNGKLKWWQQLAANTSLPIANDTSRRHMAASPSVYGNMVVCPTLSGFLVGYDLSSRTLAWAHRYSQTGNINMQINGFRGTMNESFDPMAARSSDFAPIIANGCAVFMPSESDTTSFYGLDVTTGRKLWDRSKQWDLQRSGQPPILLKYVGGIWNQRLIMVGDSSIIAVELATGQKIWNLELGSKIAGRGARNGNKYLVPVSQNEVVEVDIEQGAETNRFKLDQVAGNLVATDKALLCLGPSSLSFYVLKSRLQKEIDLDSLKAPDSGTTLTKKAEILLSEGKLDEAFESIRRAYLADPSNSECIDVLSKIGIAGIKTDFEKFGPRVLEFEGILSQWKGRSIYLTVMIEGYIRQRQFVRAVEKLLDLSEERTTRSSPSIENETIDHEKGLSVQIDRWMVARFERLWEMASARERKDIAKRIRDRVDVIQSSSQQQFRKGLRHLLSLELLSEQAVQAAVEQRRTSDWAEADFLLHDILRATSQPLAIEGESEDEQRTMYGKVQAKAASELAQLYSLVARHSTAVQIASKYRLPIDTWMPQPSALNPSLEDAYQFGSRLKNAMSPNDLTQLSDRPNRWPEGMVEVAAGPADQQGDLEGISIVPVLHEGKGLEGWEMRWNSDGIVMRNPWGFEAFTVPFQYNARTTSNSLIQGHIFHNMVYIELPTEIVAIDTLQTESSKAIRWRLPTSGAGLGGFSGSIQTFSTKSIWNETIPKAFKEYSIFGISRNGLHVRIGDELQCIHLLTKEKIWSRKLANKMIHGSRSGDQLILLDPGLAKRTVLDGRDGSILLIDDYKTSLDVRHAIGSKFLLNKRQNGENGKGEVKELQLWDSLTGKVILQRQFSDRTIGYLSEGKTFVAIDRKKAGETAKLYFWKLETGEEFEYDYEADPRTNSIRCYRFGDALVVLPNSSQDELENVQVDVPADLVVTGPIMAISAIDGRPLWKRRVMCHKFYFPVSQSRLAPTIVLTRRLKWAMDARQQTTVSMAILDLRNGETIYKSDILPSIRLAGFSQRVYPSSRETMVSWGGWQVKLQFTETDRPPSPIASIGLVTEKDLHRLSRSSETFGNESFADPFDESDLNDTFRFPRGIPFQQQPLPRNR